MLTPVAYAGFSKKGGPENLRIMKTRRKISPLRISPLFCPKLGEDQIKKKKGLRSDLVCFLAQNRLKPKKKKKKVFQSDFVRVYAQTFCPSYKRGGACRNFTCYFMLIILYWRPKGGDHGPMPPLNVPLANTKSPSNNTHYF